MSVSDAGTLSVDEFFRAIDGREGRYELVRGVAYAMAGAKRGHNIICSNIVTAFGPAGKKKGCSTSSSDMAVRTGPTTIRYPDVVVDCGPVDASALTASMPTIVVEISSPNTAIFDYGTKLREYQAIDSIGIVMQIEQEIALVKIHRRQDDGTWVEETIETFGTDIVIPSLGMSITLNDIYDTLDVRPRPRFQIVQG